MGSHRLVLAAVMVWMLAGVCPPSTAWDQPDAEGAAGEPGIIHGTVTDADGAPLGQVIVSALGAGVTALAVTDGDGRYELAALPPGPYVLRAHRAGFRASGHHVVELTPAADVVRGFVLRLTPASAPAVLAAGFVQAAARADPGMGDPGVEVADIPAHDHSELAWRLRHARRSVLKETTEAATVDDGTGRPDATSVRRRPGRSLRQATSSAFDDLSGQVNLLTSASVDRPADLFSAGAGPHGIAYFQLGAPAGKRGDWSIQGAMTQGDVSSWIVAASYASRRSARHELDVGMSYSTQRDEGGNPAIVAARRADNRTVGAVHLFDDWHVSPRLTVNYGAGAASYDYVRGAALLMSPRAGMTVSASEHLRVRATMSQAVRAPGAEEFLPPAGMGLWLPPERTFAPLASNSGFRSERARSLEVAVERDVGETYVVGVRRFQQRVSDQIVTLFGVRGQNGIRSNAGHYFVANGGSVNADGWGVTLSRRVAGRLRGSVAYSFTTARWRPSPDAALVASQVPTAVRRGTERFHDVTTSVQTDFAATATQVFVVYRVNTAYARANRHRAAPGLDGRFDVQVHQRLTFLPFTRSDWEFLVSVRNLFRDDRLGGTGGIYDELLAVRPPTRIVGGLLVRF